MAIGLVFFLSIFSLSFSFVLSLFSVALFFLSPFIFFSSLPFILSYLHYQPRSPLSSLPSVMPPFCPILTFSYFLRSIFGFFPLRSFHFFDRCVCLQQSSSPLSGLDRYFGPMARSSRPLQLALVQEYFHFYLRSCR